MAKWRHFQTFYREFGVPSGRLLCRFPGDWAKQVVQLAHQFTHDMTNSPIAAKRIEERMLGEAFKRKIVPARRPYDLTIPWLKNATILPEQLAFRAVIVETGGEELPGVLNAEELLDDPLYCVDTGEKVGRTAEELAAYALPLLKVSEELVLVDPNFKVVDPFGRPVHRFLDTLSEVLRQRQEMPHPLKRLELHLERPDEVANPTGRREFERRITNRIPKGMKMKVFLWQAPPVGERPHPRFILTEFGGIKYDYGLDEGRQGEKTMVMLLGEKLWQELRQDYSAQGQIFTIDQQKDIFVVQGI
jgi:hypothetical protein